MVPQPATEYKLVFAIVRSATFSWMLEPYAVQIMKNGMFAYNHLRVTSQTASNYVTEISEAGYSVLKLLDECRTEVLARVVGHNRFRPIEYARAVQNDEKLLMRSIRYLRQKTDMAISILADNSIPIYFKGDPQDIISEKPIMPQVEKLNVRFCFSLIEERLIYTIKTTFANKSVKLTGDNTIILNYDPCWLIMNDQFIQVSDQVDGKKIQPFLTKSNVEVEPSQVENYLKRFVRQIIGIYPFELNGIEHSFYSEKPIPSLSIESSLHGESIISLRFRYEKVEFGYLSDVNHHVSLQQKNNVHHFDIIRRNREHEDMIKDWLCDNGLVHTGGMSFRTLKVHLAGSEMSATEATYCLINFINENNDLLKENGFDTSQFLGKNFFVGRIALHQQYTEDRDWFDLKIFVMFDDVKLPFSALKKNLLENNRELVLPDGRIAILPAEWFSRFHDLALIGKPEGEHVRVKKNQFGFIENLLEGNDRIDKFISAAGKGAYPVEEEPEAMLRSLRPYQLKGMSWFMFLHKHQFGGCLSDDMGLGKTIQVLAFLLKIKQQHSENTRMGQLDLFSIEAAPLQPVGTTLIVMPLSLVHNWENEIRLTTPQLRSMSYTGLNRKFDPTLFSNFDLILTTYGTLRNDIQLLKQFSFQFVFLDESQYIKNPESKIFAAVNQLVARQRFVITGTPVENSLIDLWSQLQFVNPGLLGDLKFFRDRFYQPIQKKGSKSSEKRFRQIINPFILRRTKKEVAGELPELTEKVHYCPMTPEQLEIYERRKSEIRNYILESTKKYGADKAYMIILSGLMRMRLLANHPAITEKEYEGGSGKFDQVVEGIRKVLDGGHKLLIFSQFVKHLNLYAQYLADHEIPYLMLTGQTPAQQRDLMIKQFQKDDEFPIFLISLKAGGVGLNLTAADFVFLLDPWWNPAVEQQAINRTHRIGQDKKVISYKFITENSIEEKIMALQEKKMDLFNQFINYRVINQISTDELAGLLE